MGSKIQIGSMLIIGAICSAIGWMGLYPGGPDDTSVELAQKLLDGGATAKIAILMGYGGMIVVLTGMVMLSRGMAMGGGAGSSYTNISMILFMAVLAGMVTALGLEYGSTEAGSIQEAATLQGITNAGGAASSLILGVSMILLGVGIFVEKNLNVSTSILAVISSIALILAIFLSGDISITLQWVGWSLFLLGTILIGVFTLRSDS
ncbi:MAG: hypothetical protein FI687_05490 [SAR202 cluster bacterium]|mgnify:CR=1 FL=1|nr:hypothetical protein [SAR202 cluster bacterium]|tara:strand:+ start:9925 stop:10542 length:618 start_codon:yes stop_codon:yes gene_type:complete